MFGKLMKYELRYMIRIFAPMWAAVLALCVLSRLVLRPDLDGMMYVEGTEALLPVLAVMLAVTAIITMMVVATVVLLQRFYKGMYGDEGYLMFTLPVTSGSLIHSKALSAMLMMVGTGLLTFAGVMIMTSYPQIWNEVLRLDIGEMFKMLLEMNNLTSGEFALLAVWVVVFGLLSTAQGIYIVYLAISIGQLWKKHPVAGAIIAYYVITLVVNFLIGGLGVPMIENLPEFIMTGNDYGATMAATLIASTLYCLVLIAASVLGTKLILDKKLNIA